MCSDQELEGDNKGLHQIILQCAECQWRVGPKWWTNKVLQKMLSAGITTKKKLKVGLNQNTLNETLTSNGSFTFHCTTLKVLEEAINDELPRLNRYLH